MFSFKGKVVVVTGGTKGIGKAVAKAFAENGASVIILGRDEPEGKKAAEEINAVGNAAFIKMDIADEGQVESLAGLVEKTYGKADILVNNAGIFAPGTAADTDIAVWDRVMNVNLRGAFLVTHALLPHMLQKKKGVIVSVSSEAGVMGFKNQIAYNVSKAALLHFTRSIAIDHAEEGIRANVVCPGTTWTPLVENAVKTAEDPEKVRKQWENRPMGRLGKPEEIANAVLCLASDEIGYATGAVLSVDGGYTAR
jgi:NAD(P)-dependent dehydrogenase (short-subunit alcohol dehydrogenase family)